MNASTGVTAADDDDVFDWRTHLRMMAAVGVVVVALSPLVPESVPWVATQPAGSCAVATITKQYRCLGEGGQADSIERIVEASHKVVSGGSGDDDDQDAGDMTDDEEEEEEEEQQKQQHDGQKGQNSVRTGQTTPRTCVSACVPTVCVCPSFLPSVCLSLIHI